MQNQKAVSRSKRPRFWFFLVPCARRKELFMRIFRRGNVSVYRKRLKKRLFIVDKVINDLSSGLYVIDSEFLVSAKLHNAAFVYAKKRRVFQEYCGYGI